MAKKLVATTELELVVLQELRSMPGCERVTGVRVSRIGDPRFETNWSIVALMQDGGQTDEVRFATERAQNKLREIYNLSADRNITRCS